MNRRDFLKGLGSSVPVIIVARTLTTKEAKKSSKVRKSVSQKPNGVGSSGFYGYTLYAPSELPPPWVNEETGEVEKDWLK